MTIVPGSDGSLTIVLTDRERKDICADTLSVHILLVKDKIRKASREAGLPEWPKDQKKKGKK